MTTAAQTNQLAFQSEPSKPSTHNQQKPRASEDWPGRWAVSEQLLQWRLRHKAATSGRRASEAPPGCYLVWGHQALSCRTDAWWSAVGVSTIAAGAGPTHETRCFLFPAPSLPGLRHQSIILILSPAFENPSLGTPP